MTDQHPLTDDIIDTLASPQYDCFEGIGDVNCGFTYDDLRAAADWQLEQVIEWIKEKEYDQVDYDEIIYADDLRKAMRPTTTQED